MDDAILARRWPSFVAHMFGDEIAVSVDDLDVSMYHSDHSGIARRPGIVRHLLYQSLGYSFDTSVAY